MIARIASENPDVKGEELRKLVLESFPYGSRKNYAYKSFLDAVETVFGPSKRKLKALRKKERANLKISGQRKLF